MWQKNVTYFKRMCLKPNVPNYKINKTSKHYYFAHGGVRRIVILVSELCMCLCPLT